ncbi:angiopoietin-related protein 7-like [Amphibalanus amphitrite]|uniref:angiopoietin-related protein 7-like n=1 Tax=Amphibalanus amphitrite TaxID=1232801 RepID=UPI001C903B4A|nr:angiopoietin-related protein 7-like [Amphibalanus amphitrite]
MSDILSRLSSQDARTDQLNLRLSEQQDTFNWRLDQLNVRLDTISAQSFSQLDSLRSTLVAQAESANARFDTIQVAFDSQSKSDNTRLHSIQEALESQIQTVNARLDSSQEAMESQFSPVNARLDSMQKALETKPQPVNARLDTIQDAIESQFMSINSRLDSMQKALESQLQPVKSQLGSIQTELGSQLNSSNSHLRNLQSELHTSLDSVTSRLELFGTRVDKLAAAQQNATTRPRDCSELPSGSPSGVYTLRLGCCHSDPVEAFCDMETDGGGWTVFQRRADILPREDFYRNWTEYKDGFGDLSGEFWWGLEKLWLMTETMGRRYDLRVDLGDFDGEERYARYEDFIISSEFDGYRVTGGNYTGNAGDNMDYHFRQKFTTRDKDQDSDSGKNCAQARESGWWFNSCYKANLNGVYLSGELNDTEWRGVVWQAWRGYHHSLKSAEMKIRP